MMTYSGYVILSLLFIKIYDVDATRHIQVMNVSRAY